MELYTKSNCAPCAVVKARLQSKGISYIEKNLDDPEVLDQARRIGIRAAPTLRMYDFQGEIERWTGNEILAWLDNG